MSVNNLATAAAVSVLFWVGVFVIDTVASCFFSSLFAGLLIGWRFYKSDTANG